MRIGERLLSILSRAETSVRIAAPFIKSHSLERALLAVPEDVKVTCVTRWRPEDIASGVCDLEILDQLRERKGSTLLVHPHLHAKFFAADESCLVGSANLTHTALGWRSPSNLELLVELDSQKHGLDAWWTELLASSIVATQAMKVELRDQAEVLRLSGNPIARPEADPEDAEGGAVWAPQCPRWSGLWEAYIGDEDQMPTSAMRSAKEDLEVLAIPPGLNEVGFREALTSIFRSTMIVQEIEQLANLGLTDAAAHTLLQSLCRIPENETPRRWQLLKGWLGALYPDEYRVETNQEVLLRGRTL
jgi:hypothetical protein